MKTIKNSKEVTILEIGDKVVFNDLEYEVAQIYGYYLSLKNGNKGKINDEIFKVLNISKKDFVKNLGIDILPTVGVFPEVKSLEALTAIVSALFKEFEKQNELPKTWEEFCKRNRAKDDYFISNGSKIICVEGHRDPNSDKNLCTSKQEAEAHLAIMQLRQLRKIYVKDWEPNWNCPSAKFCILVGRNKIQVADSYYCQETLSFPTEKLAKQFLTNFKDLLEIAKPLL